MKEMTTNEMIVFVFFAIVFCVVQESLSRDFCSCCVVLFLPPPPLASCSFPLPRGWCCLLFLQFLRCVVALAFFVGAAGWCCFFSLALLCGVVCLLSLCSGGVFCLANPLPWCCFLVSPLWGAVSLIGFWVVLGTNQW